MNEWMNELQGAPSQDWVFISSFAIGDRDSTCVLGTLGGSQRQCVQSTWLGIWHILTRIALVSPVVSFPAWLPYRAGGGRPEKVSHFHSIFPSLLSGVPHSSLLSDSLLSSTPLVYTGQPWLFQVERYHQVLLCVFQMKHLRPGIQKPPALGFLEFQAEKELEPGLPSWLGISPLLHDALIFLGLLVFSHLL